MHYACLPASDLRTNGPARATVLTLVVPLVPPPRRAARLPGGADAVYREIGLVSNGASRMGYERQRAETKERLAAWGRHSRFDCTADLALRVEPGLQDAQAAYAWDRPANAKDPPERAGPDVQIERCGHGGRAAGRVSRRIWPEPQRGWHPARSRRRRSPWQKPPSPARHRS